MKKIQVDLVFFFLIILSLGCLVVVIKWQKKSACTI